MDFYEIGNMAAKIVLVQPVDARDTDSAENEATKIREITGKDFCLAAFPVQDWNKELSPWKAPAVFGKEDFGEGAGDTLREILKYCVDPAKTYYIGGYSLAGLFALWAVHQTDIFAGVAAVSPSVWFPEFDTYLKDHEIRCGNVYLSLGDKEERTKNPVMAEVGNRIRWAQDLFRSRGVSSVLEWNEGNHFKEPDLRMAKGFAHFLL
jgi:hypothetical protein